VAAAGRAGRGRGFEQVEAAGRAGRGSRGESRLRRPRGEQVEAAAPVAGGQREQRPRTGEASGGDAC
jgi:hypothetical protein